jgi:diguanylate cyclase (GGDEF)-like protein
MSPVVIPTLDDLSTDPDALPSSAGIAMEVLRLIESEDCDLSRLERTIETDPALTVRILQVANSAMFGLSRDVSNISQATVLLGMRTIRLMALSFSLTDCVPRSGESGGFSFDEFWRRGIVSSVVARRLADVTSPQYGDDAYVAGLLGHLGRVVLATKASEAYSRITSESVWPNAQEERAVLGFASDELTGSLLSRWGLPEAMAAAVRGRDVAIGEVPDELLTRILHVALHAETVLDPQGEGDGLSGLIDAASRCLGLEEYLVEEVLATCESDARATAQLLHIDLNDTSHLDLLDRARKRMLELSVTALQDEEERRRELVQENRRLADEARVDKLTGLANRAAFDAFLDEQAQARTRHVLPGSLALLIFDIDHFKNVNDVYGHPAGDAVLAAIGNKLAEIARRGELMARYGGEEFVLVLPVVQDDDELTRAAERIRAAISQLLVETTAGALTVTMSVGGASLDPGSSDIESLVERADRALYQSKENGRDRVTIERRS